MYLPLTTLILIDIVMLMIEPVTPLEKSLKHIPVVIVVCTVMCWFYETFLNL